MPHQFQDANVADGDLVTAQDMSAALSMAPLVFADGATQLFTPDGQTIYTEHGRPTKGEWSIVEDGTFASFWPPEYRATYNLRWTVEGTKVVGLSFTEMSRGQRFDGRYQ